MQLADFMNTYSTNGCYVPQYIFFFYPFIAVCLSLCLFCFQWLILIVIAVSNYPSTYLLICYQPIYLYLSTYVCICLSIHPFTYPSIYLSAYLSKAF